MFQPKVVFEENKLSDTVVEFKIAKVDKLHPLYVVVLGLLLSISVWGVLIKWIVLQFLCVVLLLSMVLVMKYSVKEESIIVIKNFGIQLRAKYLFGSEKTEFLDTDMIDAVNRKCRFCLSTCIQDLVSSEMFIGPILALLSLGWTSNFFVKNPAFGSTDPLKSHQLN